MAMPIVMGNRMREFVPLTKVSRALSVDSLNSHLSDLKGWHFSKESGQEQIFCLYKFDNFKESMDFANLLAQLAEYYNHHPTLIVKWGSVQVHWCTYQLKGIHANDLFMAKKCDELFQSRH